MQGKVVVVKVPKMNANPTLDGGSVLIIIDNSRKLTNDWKAEPHYYTSSLGGTVAFMLIPSAKSKYLTGLK